MENSQKNPKKVVLTQKEREEIVEAMEVVSTKEGETLAGGWLQGGFSKAAHQAFE